MALKFCPVTKVPSSLLKKIPHHQQSRDQKPPVVTGNMDKIPPCHSPFTCLLPPLVELVFQVFPKMSPQESPKFPHVTPYSLASPPTLTPSASSATNDGSWAAHKLVHFSKVKSIFVSGVRFEQSTGPLSTARINGSIPRRLRMLL